MKIDIVTKTRNTKWKFIILTCSVSISFVAFILYKLEFLGFFIMGYTFIACFLLLLFISWIKNYKVNGLIELGENSIKLYEYEKLIRTFKCESDKITSVTIKWEAFSFCSDLVRIFNGFLYFDSWNDSLVIHTETDCYSFNIVMEQYKKDRKGVDWIFNKLEERGIKTGYERKKESLRPTICKRNASKRAV